MNLPDLLARQRRSFQSGVTRQLDFRQQQLERLQQAIEKHERALLAALHADLRKPPHEAYTTELGFVLGDIRYARRHLPAWMKPHRRPLPWLAWPGRAEVQAEPYGVVLIIGPWNYPFQLLFSPLVGALAAGNCVVLKPSENAPHTARAMVELVADAFPADYVAVAEGGRSVSEALVRQPFDKIFFTGGTAAGRAVAMAAAQQLVPVTLELGGKCPAIVCADAALELAARRIAWGKFMNAGQTCVAPDFVAADRRIAAALVDALHRAVRSFYGDQPQRSPDYGRIINRQHFDRLMRLLAAQGVPQPPGTDGADLYLPPTIIADVSWESPLLQEEIFGPILPVVTFDALEAVVDNLRERPAPLALYLFTNDRATQQQLIATIRSGGVCINDTIVQIVGHELPFGGVGASGMGRYHGRASFDCFSYPRPVVRRATRPDWRFRYPPPRMSLPALKRLYRFLRNH